MKQQMLPRHGEMVQKGYLTLLAKIVVLLIVLIFTGCRSEKEHRATNIDLSKRLSYAEKSASSNIIVFGSPEAKQFLGEGWS
ncbi:hypothetical protein L0152_19495, partial [bacterium]|nr:hypothetical protein [bacterium]